MGDAEDAGLDEVIHAPIRLRICGLLRQVEQLDFQLIKSTLDIADARLSKNLKVLVDAGYVTLSKTSSASRQDARRITWVRMTKAGQQAFEEHLRALRAIVSTEHIS